MTDITALNELLRTAQRSALHLEMRDTYAGASPAFAAHQAGRPFDRSGQDTQWHGRIGPLVVRGVDVRRARIVSEPVSDYIRFEWEVTPLANLRAGEKVRWLSRRRASGLALPGNDFWLVDEEVLFLHFSGDGELVDTESATDPAAVKLCGAAFEAVWERAIDHADYRAA